MVKPLRLCAFERPPIEADRRRARQQLHLGRHALAAGLGLGQLLFGLAQFAHLVPADGGQLLQVLLDGTGLLLQRLKAALVSLQLVLLALQRRQIQLGRNVLLLLRQVLAAALKGLAPGSPGAGRMVQLTQLKLVLLQLLLQPLELGLVGLALLLQDLLLPLHRLQLLQLLQLAQGLLLQHDRREPIADLRQLHHGGFEFAQAGLAAVQRVQGLGLPRLGQGQGEPARTLPVAVSCWSSRCCSRACTCRSRGDSSAVAVARRASWVLPAPCSCCTSRARS